jgi:hypothetical protein
MSYTTISTGDSLPSTPQRRKKGSRGPKIAVAALAVAALGVGVFAGPVRAAESASGDQAAAQKKVDKFDRTDLVTDDGRDGTVADPNLIDPIGMSDGASPLWVSNEGADNSTLYSGAVAGSPITVVPLVVAIPGGKPTGQVFNGGGAFNVTQNGVPFSSVFIFAGRTGQITGWNPGLTPRTSAVTAWTTPGAVYTGLTIATATAGRQIYAADFHGRKVDVFDSNFQPVNTPGAFQDRFIPKNFAPFNVFTPDGVFVKRLVTAVGLNSPWGLQIAPTGFGDKTGDLLVANHGSGLVSTYDADNGKFKGFLLDNAKGKVFIEIKGLWGLLVGNGVAGDPSAILFTAGPDKGTHGTLGELTLGVDTPASA